MKIAPEHMRSACELLTDFNINKTKEWICNSCTDIFLSVYRIPMRRGERPLP